jgi:hypothetical protein
MRKLTGLVMGALSLGAMVLVSATPADARCSRVGVSGVGLTRMMAMDFAKMGLDTEIAFQNKKAAGKVNYRCNASGTECRASRRAC